MIVCYIHEIAGLQPQEMQSRGGLAFSLSPALHSEKAAGLGPCHPWLLSAGLTPWPFSINTRL